MSFFARPKTRFMIPLGFTLCLVFVSAFQIAHGEETLWARPDAGLKQRFLAPPADTRILKMIHQLPDEAEKLPLFLELLKRQGFGGAVTNVSFTDYFKSEAKWESFIQGIQEAKKQGFALWLYDECGYPSGPAGGLTLVDHPEYEAEGLHVIDASAHEGKISFALPPGTLEQALAVPFFEGVGNLQEAIDVSNAIKDGYLEWDIPDGDWRVCVFTKSKLYEGTHAEASIAFKFPYIDLLAPEPTARFIEITHDEYARRLGSDLGKFFESTFTDEPSLMSVFLSKQKNSVLPWSPVLRKAFQEQQGYDVSPLLPALVMDTGAEGKKIRYDFWQTIGNLVSENYFGQLQQWGREHNIPSGGHLLAEEMFLAHIPFYGNFFQCLRRFDTPGMDCLTSLPHEVPVNVARMIGSVADLDERPLTMCETSNHSQHYRPEGDTRPVRVVTEDEIRGTCNLLMINGINTITSYYVFKGFEDEQLKRINDWVGRCCTLSRGGYQVNDVALFYPAESGWIHFTPSNHWVDEVSAEARSIERILHSAENDLFRSKRGYTHIDTQTLVEARAESGALKFKNLSWRVVVLPAVDTLPLAAWKKLEAFYQSGGVIFALGARPQNSESLFPSEEVLTLGNALFGTGDEVQIITNESGGAGIFLPHGMESLLATLLDDILEKDGSFNNNSDSLRMSHRFVDDAHLYFLINDSSQAWEGTMDLPCDGKAEAWDPETGTVVELQSAANIPVSLKAYGAMFYRLDNVVKPRKKIFTSSNIPKIMYSALPSVIPELAHGTYVIPSQEQNELLSALSTPVWQFTAQLTESNVDCFLFASFNFPDFLDLSHESFLSLRVGLPEKQKISNALLVVLRDATGAEYLAEGGITLNAAGNHRLHIPLKNFATAHWSLIQDKPLDLSQISAVRIGWGGYFGSAGETVQFSCAIPELAQLR